MTPERAELISERKRIAAVLELPAWRLVCIYSAPREQVPLGITAAVISKAFPYLLREGGQG